MSNSLSTSSRVFLGIGTLGWIPLLGTLALIGCQGTNRTASQIDSYHKRLAATGGEPEPEIPSELTAFIDFLKGLDDPAVAARATEIYAPDAVLHDTLVTKKGNRAIEEHFEKTAKAMTEYRVTIDDVARSGRDWYIRWTLVYRSDKLAGGEEIHSVGISQVRLDEQGRVVFHHDFWDSAHAFFDHVPVIGSGIQAIRSRL